MNDKDKSAAVVRDIVAGRGELRGVGDAWRVVLRDRYDRIVVDNRATTPEAALTGALDVLLGRAGSPSVI